MHDGVYSASGSVSRQARCIAVHLGCSPVDIFFPFRYCQLFRVPSSSVSVTEHFCVDLLSAALLLYFNSISVGRISVERS